ncbi:hypothetical protein PENSPDRAFT_109573 [Peniophora sp. CONT]|nr:hypothetical protein PENSPDRAFT_109573 [Peniophora sp. CONT]
MGEGAVVDERKGVSYSPLPSDNDELPERAQDRLYREWKMRINIAERPQEEPLFASSDDLSLPPPLYNRLSDNALGDVDAPEDDEQPRCFNCGELGHRIPECTERRDRQRVASARMRFEAEGQLSSPWGSLTGHSSIDERLAMLRAFAPGEVRGTVLRDALGLHHNFRDRGHNAPWMANVAEWGYPPGWYASWDPMAFLRHHVATSERGNDASSKLFIFADAEVELLDLNSAGDSQEAASPDAVRESMTEQPSSDEGSSHRFPPRRRWAFYPFRDDLPVYNAILPYSAVNDSATSTYAATTASYLASSITSKFTFSTSSADAFNCLSQGCPCGDRFRRG